MHDDVTPAPEPPARPIWRRILRWVLGVVAVVLALLLGLVAFFSAVEYRPKQVESVPAVVAAALPLDEVDSSQELTVLTWNIGYAGLGANADFFMDGGEEVQGTDETRMEANLRAIADELDAVDPDIAFLQEVDRDSTRSYGIDQEAFLTNLRPGAVASFAHNFKVTFLPYPIPPIGKVDSGILTLADGVVTEAYRESLPVPFEWPVSMFNLKRGLLVNRMSLEGTDRELVTINLHLEAYDDGEGKRAQTEALMRIIDAETAAGNLVIAGGDFNQTFPDADPTRWPVVEGSWQPGDMEDGAFDGVQLVGDASVPTARSLQFPYEGVDPDEFQHYVIDGFLVSEGVEVLSVETLDLGFEASDHNPVVLKVQLS